VHPLRHPRNALIVGLLFVFIAVVYFLGPTLSGGYVGVDVAGVTMLGALGIAMGLMAYVLIAGSPRD
jgi:TRAP-type C4-dicarboxylate transport system permease small subunit